MKTAPRILFVTRNFPPSVGGLQKASYELHKAMAGQAQVKLIKWGGSRYALPVVYPVILIRTLVACWRNQADVVYLQDGVLAVTAVFIKFLTRKPVVITLHGLDLNFKLGFYQWLLRTSLKCVDEAITASDWSRDIIKHKFPNLPVNVIGHGVNDDFYDASVMRSSQPTILTTGRLVKRKGVAWFASNVMPQLVTKHPNLQYIVLGGGPMESAIKAAIKKHDLGKNVQLLGKVNIAQRNHYYNLADLFIMPNMHVDGDGEGFGLVALEAASCGTPVIGAAIEGVKNAVTNGKSGYLVKSQDAPAFINTIDKQLASPSLSRAGVRNYVLSNCLWQQIASQYLLVLASVTE